MSHDAKKKYLTYSFSILPYYVSILYTICLSHKKKNDTREKFGPRDTKKIIRSGVPNGRRAVQSSRQSIYTNM